MNKTNERKDRLGRAPVEAGATVRFGIDQHADQLAVVRQVEGQLSQPPQRFSRPDVVRWIRAHVQAGATVHSCYEAGPCGYGLHRELEAMGVTNYVVAPQRWDRSGRGVKTDGLDAAELCDRLVQYERGHRRVFTVVKVPTLEQEQRRGLCRYRGTLIKERQRCIVRGFGLMLAQDIRVHRDWWQEPNWHQLREQLPAWLREQVQQWQSLARDLDHKVEEVTRQVLALGRSTALPKGYGALTDALVQAEVLDWNRFKNRRQAGSYTGLCPSEHSTGTRRRQGSINRHGNPRIRHLLVEAVWRLLYWQLNYAPLQKVRAAQGSRQRRRAVVAAARHLAVDLWRMNTGQCTAEQLGLILVE